MLLTTVDAWKDVKICGRHGEEWRGETQVAEGISFFGANRGKKKQMAEMQWWLRVGLDCQRVLGVDGKEWWGQ